MADQQQQGESSTGRGPAISLVPTQKYRKDIDGLRAIAVLFVIFYHFGWLSQGFLGVDVFFVISGFLITGIIYKEAAQGRFSIIKFYLRRTRRIIPLALFISMVALAIGLPTMLPDDLENLSASVIATNFFSNNILQALTTKNYWDVVNEYKPLMHTWSLGVEEHYYFLYPFVFMLLGKSRLNWGLPLISTLAAVSLALYLLPYHSDFEKFYVVFFRFWELALGGIAAIVLRDKLVNHRYALAIVLLLVLLLSLPVSLLSPQIALILSVVLTLGILISSNSSNKWSSLVLEGKWLVFIGKISFSLYMWHQVLLAYFRYLWGQETTVTDLIALFILTFLLSVATYYFIEQPFRDRARVGTATLLTVVLVGAILSTGVSAMVYLKAGVLRDIPELGIKKDNVVRGLHGRYNSKIYELDTGFLSSDKIKVLVVGNSFARDWANVLLESSHADKLEVSYVYAPEQCSDFGPRSVQADVVFYSTASSSVAQTYAIDTKKLWCVGTKNFGISNGKFYNYRGPGYYDQRTAMERGYFESNEKLSEEWGDRYLDYIEKVIDSNRTVRVFTPDHLFISQDCRHLTEAGARYFAQLFNDDLGEVFADAIQQKNELSDPTASTIR